MKSITRTFHQDYEFGKAKEIESLPSLNSFFNTTLTHNDDKYAPFDFENDTLAIEQKARHCRHSSYTDTMLQYNKIKNCYLPKYLSKEKWFVFSFEDGLYGIKYDENRFLEYTTRFSKIPDRVGITEQSLERIYIPVADLIHITGASSHL